MAMGEREGEREKQGYLKYKKLLTIDLLSSKLGPMYHFLCKLLLCVIGINTFRYLLASFVHVHSIP